jgi:dihydrolipoamide dehydrogenase
MVHVAVIGAYGSAGAAVAGELVDEPDVELTLIDGGDPGGGLCILRGCMPSKEVLSAAAHRYQPRVDHRLTGAPHEVDLEAVVEQKNEHTLGWAAHRREGVESHADRDDVEFIDGTARFVDAHTLEVDGCTIEPDYIVVATGSTVNVPDIPGIEEVDYATSAEVLDAAEFPDSAVVIGFGYIGMEMVPYIAEAGGTDVTVVEHDERPLDEADPAFGDELLEIYERDFTVDVVRESVEQRVEPTDDGGVRLFLEGPDGEQVVEGDQLYLFTGRNPALEGLELENTPMSPGVGWVEHTVQARDAPRVFVPGDANGREKILHVAKEEGFTAAENILRDAHGEDLVEYHPTHHHVVFSGLGVYPYARVGHSVESAEAADLDHVTVSRRAEDDGVFKSKDAADGLATLVVDPDDGTVLGWQGLHYHADVMAKTMQVAVEMELDVRALPDRAYHPTTPEILDGLFRDAAAAVED